MCKQLQSFGSAVHMLVFQAQLPRCPIYWIQIYPLLKAPPFHCCCYGSEHIELKSAGTLSSRFCSTAMTSIDMASATVTSIAATILTVDGTPTEFLPLPTPWPSGYGCTGNIYLHTPVSSPNTFLAWDPLFGASMVSSARSCLPPQVTSRWSQAASATPYTALGPTFVCLQAYSAIQAVLIASSLEQMLCCPSYVSLN